MQRGGQHIRLGRVATATRSIRRWWAAKVELVFDPLGLTRIEVRLAGAPMGADSLAPHWPAFTSESQTGTPRRGRNPAGILPSLVSLREQC